MQYRYYTYLIICVAALFSSQMHATSLHQRHSDTHAVSTLPCASNIHRGVRHLYNLDFDKAEELFNNVVEKEPAHPVGYVYRAYVSLLRQMVGGNTRMAQAQYTNNLTRALACAFKPKARGGPWFRFYRGIALVMQAHNDAENGDFLAAMQWCKRGLHEMTTVAAHPATQNDALCLLGMYHYFISDAPWYVRAVSSVMLLPPDAVYGLRCLEDGAETSEMTQTEVKLSLVTAYLRERMNTRSLLYINELSTQYPDNLWIELLRQETLVSTKDIPAAVAAAIENLGRIQKDTRPWMRGLLIDQHYALGRYYQMATNYTEALVHFEKAATQPAQKPRLKALARLHQGMILDCLGRRQHARNAYAAVQSMSIADPYVVKQATVYMSHPYEGVDTFAAGGGL